MLLIRYVVAKVYLERERVDDWTDEMISNIVISLGDFGSRLLLIRQKNVLLLGEHPLSR